MFLFLDAVGIDRVLNEGNSLGYKRGEEVAVLVMPLAEGLLVRVQLQLALNLLLNRLQLLPDGEIVVKFALTTRRCGN